MELTINAETRQFDADRFTVASLLETLDVEQRKGVAVALNDSVVPRSQWDATHVEDGDRLEIIRATQGG
jgi:sulfur carrier protein